MTHQPADRASESHSVERPAESPAVAFFLLSLTFALFSGAALYVISSPELRELGRFEATVRAVLTEYPREINGDGFFKSSSEEIYGLLDRYSHYTPAQSYTQVVEEYSGAYAGIGVTIVSEPNGLLIASVNPSGPAKDMGVMLGDVIISADSVSLAGKTTAAASQILRGRAGDSVVVGFLRPRTQTAPVSAPKGDLAFKLAYDTIFTSMVRRAVPLSHVTLFGVTPEKTLYVRLNDFGAGAAEQFQRALDSVRRVQPDNHGILIDLRNNPGGLLSEALKLANYFLADDALLLGEKGKSRWSRREFHGWSADQTDGAPVVIMVNRNSASAAEVFSGALKFAGRATLVGDTTFGKGLIQEYNSFADGSASKLTIGRYYFTGERYLNQPGAEKVDSGSGLAPDVCYQFSSDEPFIRALASKMLFTKFAGRYQERIISAFERHDYGDVISEFRQRVSESDFDFRSELLQRANALYLWTALHDLRGGSQQLSDSILRKAEELESDLFNTLRDRIMRRLALLAYERRDGAREAFLRVTLPGDSDIDACEKILLRRSRARSDTTKAGV